MAVTSLDMATVVVYSVVSVLSMLGNGAVIWVTAGFRAKRTVNTVWYLNLAVADFLATAFLPLKITWTALDKHWGFGTFACKMDGVVFYMNMYASVYTLSVIGADRCACVAFPVWSRNHRTVRTASWVSLGVWVLAAAPSLPYFIFRDTRRSGDNVRCYTNYAFADDYANRTAEELRLHNFRFGAMTFTCFLVGFVLPFTAIVSCYSVVVHRLRNNRLLAGRSGRSFRIIASVIAAFFLCWAPFHAMNLTRVANHLAAEYSHALRHVLSVGIPVTFALALLNSCLNPLLYVFLGQQKGPKGVLFCKSILKVLEKALAEAPPPQSNASVDPDANRQETAFSETLL